MKKWIEECVVHFRLTLYDKGLPCSPKAIKKYAETKHSVIVWPSISTIARILKQNCLTHKRTGYYKEDYITSWDELVKNSTLEVTR